MSMNVVRDELKRFERELDRFNDVVRSGVSALEKEHEKIDGIWRDDFRKVYDARWASFGTHAKKYSGREAAKYSSFIRGKIQRIEQYLNG
jgi:hypothetical protein